MSREWVRTMDMAFKLQENNKKKKKTKKGKKEDSSQVVTQNEEIKAHVRRF
jgi:ribosomal protein S25